MADDRRDLEAAHNKEIEREVNGLKEELHRRPDSFLCEGAKRLERRTRRRSTNAF